MTGWSPDYTINRLNLNSAWHPIIGPDQSSGVLKWTKRLLNRNYNKAYGQPCFDPILQGSWAHALPKHASTSAGRATRGRRRSFLSTLILIPLDVLLQISVCSHPRRLFTSVFTLKRVKQTSIKLPIQTRSKHCC